jgi:hypothetical protein
MEHWVEINLFAEVRTQDSILLDVLWPYVKKLRARGALVTFHYFREPGIRFRVRLKNRAERSAQKRALEGVARRLAKRGEISGWSFGRHGEPGFEYTGEEDRYGKNGWKVAQMYFEDGAETALILLDLKRRSRLESALWAKGLGNPWEGGESNPWREKVADPLAFHWSRYVHLFSNQLGFDMQDEAGLSARQAEGYRRVHDEVGMEW